jgi:NAD(P)-dependent dehydrogenase (short-subunit alcohol dehydrogenase family)
MVEKILISGSGSGLGRALALRYAKQGAEICVSDVNVKTGEETVALITEAGGNAFFIECDITKQWDVDKLALKVAEKWRSLDMLINNAGVASAGLLESESMEQWQWVLDINVLGHVRMTKAFLPLLKVSKSADKNILNVASQAGLTPAPGMGSYSLSKAAMVSFSETSYLELASHGIHVSVVCPAFFETNLGDSLRGAQGAMDDMVQKMIKQSGVTAQEIAEIIDKQVVDRKFMIITHKNGRKAHRLKRYLPIEKYLKMMVKRTGRFAQPADDTSA